jgi:pyruvyltransferase
MDRIKAYWYSPRREGKGDFENFGDRIAEEIIKFLCYKSPQWTNPKKTRWYHRNLPVYLTVGSIVKRSTKQCSIWGSGIKEEKRAPKGIKEVHCVRGPLTRKFLIKQGYTVPEIYGDPGLLLPLLHCIVSAPQDHFCVIPHYVDFKKTNQLFAGIPNVKVVDLCAPVTEVISDIASCRAAISSSLHGIIVSHAYQIPCVQGEFSSLVSGNGIKFKDYFQSVNIKPYEPFQLAGLDAERLLLLLGKITEDYSEVATVSEQMIRERQRCLLESCPFIHESRL